jgi:hypothetical protein
VLRAQGLRSKVRDFSAAMDMEKARALTQASDMGDSRGVWMSEEKPIVPIDP